MFRPPLNRGMRVLDRSLFDRQVQLSAAKVPDVKKLATIRQELQRSRDLLDLRMVIPIRPAPADPLQKCMLLHPAICFDDKRTWSDTLCKLHGAGDVSLTPYLLDLHYSHWTATEILSAILPEDLLQDIPSGFNPVGHVAHVNLRERYLPYKQLIAQVIMDKNPSIRTVINKVDTLSSQNQYRVLDYEVIGGEPDLDVEVREAGSIFRFNYGKVFWNSRLGTEHQRLVDRFLPGEAVCDVMAGVGPFAIPAGKKEVFVWANDLNPDCYQGLVDATSLNKVQHYVRAFNEDGHSFIRSAVDDLRDNDYVVHIPLKASRRRAVEQLTPASKQYREVSIPKSFSHFVMNLPRNAIDFLPAFIGLHHGQELMFDGPSGARLPLVHCYCFMPKSDDEERDHEAAEKHVWETVEAKIGCRIDRANPNTELYDVRDVAPNKRQFCATFRLPASVAFRRRES